MKKLFVAAIVVAFMLGFASCTVNGECECTFSAMGTVVTTQTYEDTTKSECKEAEKAGNEAGGGLATVKCVFR